MTRLFLVRHALAAAPGDLRLPGPDLSLRPEGVAQAERLARRLRALAPSTVFSSAAARARETGEIIATICHTPLEVTAALREIDVGEWAGKTYAEIVAADPAARNWFTDPDTGGPPGGEAIALAAERVLRVLAELGSAGPDRAVIVGHAGSLRLALAAALGMPLASYWRLRLDCASLTMVTWTEDGVVLERLNDTGHLVTEHSDGVWEGTAASRGFTLTPLPRRPAGTRPVGAGRGGRACGKAKPRGAGRAPSPPGPLSHCGRRGEKQAPLRTRRAGCPLGGGWGEGGVWQSADDALDRASQNPAADVGP